MTPKMCRTVGLQILVSAMLLPRRESLRPCLSGSGRCQGNGGKAFRLVPSFPSGAMRCPTIPPQPCRGPRSPYSSAVPPPLPPISRSLAAPVFSHELPAHDLESDEFLCDLGLRVVRGAVEAKECENWYRILIDSCGTQPDAIWDLLCNAHSREECLADPKLPPRWGTRPGKLISLLGRDPLQQVSQQAVQCSLARDEGSLPNAVVGNCRRGRC